LGEKAPYPGSKPGHDIIIMPYYGRGGAGNIQAVEEENARISADLEANQQAAEAENQQGLSDRSKEQQYAHTGRGGAGNWYSPRELRERGHFSDADRSHILGDGTQPPTDSARSGDNAAAPPSYTVTQTSSQTSKVGRGGAGNISFGVNEDEERAARKRLAQQEAQEKLKADIEKGVKERLAMPPKAKLPGGDP
jgi:hypothetical protein